MGFYNDHSYVVGSEYLHTFIHGMSGEQCVVFAKRASVELANTEIMFDDQQSAAARRHVQPLLPDTLICYAIGSCDTWKIRHRNGNNQQNEIWTIIFFAGYDCAVAFGAAEGCTRVLSEPRYRIALQISVADPFWVQVRETVLRQANAYNCDLVTLTTPTDGIREVADVTQIYEELRVQQVHALICNSIDRTLLSLLCMSGIAVIDASESTVIAPLYTSRRGLYDAAYALGEWLRVRIAANATVLVVGGFDEMGLSRLSGIRAALAECPQMDVIHISCEWQYQDGYHAVTQWLADHPGAHIDAVFGLSDSLALGGRDAVLEAYPARPRPLVCGINGDPLALADISRGRMEVTIETMLEPFGAAMLELVIQAVTTGNVPESYDPQRRLIDASNVSDVALEKLISLADLPTRLVGVNIQREHERVRQFETSLAITQRVGAILDHGELIDEVATLIRQYYGYDSVTLWRFDADGNLTSSAAKKAILRGTPLAAALAEERAIYIPDTHISLRYDQHVHAVGTRTRVVLPVRFNEAITGLLDLQNTTLIPHARGELVGLQLVANQIGIALQNIDLFQAARQAQFVAEQADSFKTRLLANVSHELRTPLHIILGYSQLLVTDPAPHGVTIAAEVRNDIITIQRSAEHLVLLINDLLDLSRAEIDELVLFPEQTDIKALLDASFTELMMTLSRPGVVWESVFPEPLPLLHVDPTRMRQILANLLGNAAKFTAHGSISIGAQPEPPYVHIWVRDTGTGISADQQDAIFEPFVSIAGNDSSNTGVGLGLAITRRLVALHRGILTVESELGGGSTFHVYLPVRSITGDYALPHNTNLPLVVAVLGEDEWIPSAVTTMAERIGVPIIPITTVSALNELASRMYPEALIWDTSRSFRDERSVIDFVQQHPVLARVPFFVYDSAQRRGTLPILQQTFDGNQRSNPFSYVGNPVPGSRPHIVIVDDDPRTHDLYHDIIANVIPDALVTSVSDGSLLADTLQSVPLPTMFILDLVMPGQDGFVNLAWIRSQPHYARLPVVVLSGKVLTRTEVQQLQFPQTVLRPKVGNTYLGMTELLQQIVGNGLANPPHLSTAARHALAYIQQNYAERLSRERIASEAGVSESYLTQVFQNELGVTPWTYLARYRIAKACHALLATNESITDVAISVGFDDPGYFSKVFRNETGATPREYRSRGFQNDEHMQLLKPE